MNIAKIVDKQYCLGCGLCSSVAGNNKLQMIEQEDGFIIPVSQKGFDGEISSLRRYCPGVTVKLNRPLQSKMEKLYGPLLCTKVAHANGQIFRFRGSSGGCLTAILCTLLKQGRVDGVLQAGASKEFPTKTEPYFSQSVDEIISHAGSRYAPSSLLKNFKQILDDHDRIAVVGKPCDIVAIRQFLDIHPKDSKKVYCTLSFVCMGLPSQNATRRLISSLGVDDPDQVKELRYRGFGWPGETLVTTNQHEKFRCSYDESWGKILGRDLHFRCKICPDGWGSFADISSGDAWYTDGKGPLFDEKPGRSFLFIRTPLGKEIIDTISESITLTDYDMSELPIIQKSQHTRKNRIWSSYIILKIFGDRLLNFKGLGMWSRIFKTSPVTIAKDVCGIVKRLPR